MQTIKKLLFLLSSQELVRAGLISLMIILMALIDMIGVASILPFIAVLTNPVVIETNIILSEIFKFSNIFGVNSNQQFLFVLGILVFTLLIISLSFKSFTTYILLRFVQSREYSIGKRIVVGYLHQPYSWFLSQHSANLGKTILSEVEKIVGLGLNPFMELIAKGAVTISLIALLIIVDPKLALIIGFSLSGAYGLIFYFTRSFLNRIGEKRLENNQLRFLAISEAFGAVKDVKVGGLEETYIKNFSKSANIYARTIASSGVVAQLPRYILEAIAFGGILLIILYMMTQTGSFNNSLPILSLYVFAGYRLLPALQQIYLSITQLTFIGPSLDKIYLDLKSLKPYNNNQVDNLMSYKNVIALKNINYNYPNTSQTALKDISLNIPVKSMVGIVGATGSGKTTLVDIILGLLEPQQGTLEVDDNIITKENLRSWQSLIGYVPQHIYLSDDTVAANIAFGIEPKDIDHLAVKKSAKIANLHDFVINELPNKYHTTIGERGVRLSGGQRQRIGIARALYHNPEVLILDEATSALDNQTEQEVISAINKFSKDMTIIIIAHRLNTLKNCDIIYKLSKGQLIAQETFNEIIKKQE